MNEITSRRAAEDRLIERASQDESFRTQLIENPHGAIEGALNIRVPADVTVKVLEETPRTLYLVLPTKATADKELTVGELESVAGGLQAVDSAWGKVKGSYVGDTSLKGTTGA